MIIAPCTLKPASADAVYQAKVQRVFDGDGFLADVWHPIRQSWISRIPFRFAFIDAPEMEQPFGFESREFLNTLIGGKALRLDPVFKGSTELPMDSYKRLLCMGFLTEQLDAGRVEYYHEGKPGNGSIRKERSVTRNIELEMIVNGFAWVLKRYAFSCEEEYYGAEDFARQNRRGLWASANPEAPWKFKGRQKRRHVAEVSQDRLI